MAVPKYMAVQAAAMIVGAAFVVIGVLGFVPGATAHLDRLGWAGHHSGAMLFGVFSVSVLHNLLHVVTGALGFVMARTYAAARAYFLGAGLVYLALWVHGLLIDPGSAANIIPVNSAATWLNLGLGIGMVLLGLMLAGQHDPTRRRTRVRA